ncbi:ATP-binding protein [Caproiciproducens sp. NJN-50]|uniref:DNA polymerase III subunit n=1 Tax=Acutalibacteraceae TaxID=3082771 RepID=UPI000FFDFF8B|nr:MULTISPECIES: ATP-binding protein [Acutalibacteraceae]QAT51011.1 ATP-binding protein [Caproiciproducens sp. NJN-50]
MNFEGFSGNPEVKRSLSLAFDEGRFPHAVLLEGSPGSGTDILSGILAKAAVCLAENERPCGRCPGCVKAAAGSHPDILTLDGDGNPRVFPVDAVREIRAGAYILPNEAPRKVYRLLGVHNMAEPSQNALLKVLEEPPENVIFLLTAFSASALLPTIRSRVQIFTLEDGGGSEEGRGEAAAVARAVVAPGEAELLFQTAPLIRDRDRLRAVLAQLFLLLRDAAVLRAGGNSSLSGESGAAAYLASKLTRKSLMLLLEETGRARRALEQNANAALLVTALCAGLREAAGKS